ncbi:unnamed protein product, partial [Mesorhabditis spiculigera]
MDLGLDPSPAVSCAVTSSDVVDVAFLNDGVSFVTLSADGETGLTLWAPAEFEPFSPENSLAFVDADSSALLVLPHDLVAIGLSDGTLAVADASKTSKIDYRFRTKKPLTAEITSLCTLGSESGKAVSGSADGTIMVVDLASETATKLASAGVGAKSMCSISGGTMICVGHMAGRLTLWDTREKLMNGGNARPTSTILLESNRDSVTSISAHPAQANMFAFSTESGSIGFVDVKANGRAVIVEGISGGEELTEITKVQFHPTHGENLFVSSVDGKLKHYDASRAQVYSFGATLPVADRQVSWLLSSLHDSLRTTEIFPKSGTYPVSFDVLGNSVVAAYNTGIVKCIDCIQLS